MSFSLRGLWSSKSVDVQSEPARICEESLGELEGNLPPVAHVTRAKRFFDDLSDSLDMRSRLGLNSERRRVPNSVPLATLPENHEMRVRAVFEDYFDPERWAPEIGEDASDILAYAKHIERIDLMKHIWAKSVPDTMKKLSFRAYDQENGESVGSATPASIYMTALSTLQRNAPPVPQIRADNVINMAEIRAA